MSFLNPKAGIMMINETLRLIRIIHDLSLTDLAKQLGISVGQLSKIENGNATPSLELIEKYAFIFRTTSSALLLFAENLDTEKKRSKVKISIRNKMFKLLQMLGDYKDDKENRKKTSRAKPAI